MSLVAVSNYKLPEVPPYYFLIVAEREKQTLLSDYVYWLVKDYRVDVTYNEVHHALRVLTARLSAYLVIGGKCQVPLKKILKVCQQGQNGQSDKINLILNLFLFEIRKQNIRQYLPYLGYIKIVGPNLNQLEVQVDVDLEKYALSEFYI